MRRSDREVNDIAELTDILRRADTMRLGLRGSPYPYVVPLSYGFEEKGGVITLYFHGAKEGLKHDLINADPHVCAEISIFHRYAFSDTGVTVEYESFIGFGRAERVSGIEARKGLDLLIEHCALGKMEYGDDALERTGYTR